MAKCIGCGIKLQTVDENLPGYVPLLVSANLGENVYCKRINDNILKLTGKCPTHNRHSLDVNC
jgi:hypothetical protein